MASFLPSATPGSQDEIEGEAVDPAQESPTSSQVILNQVTQDALDYSPGEFEDPNGDGAGKSQPETQHIQPSSSSPLSQGLWTQQASRKRARADSSPGENGVDSNPSPSIVVAPSSLEARLESAERMLKESQMEVQRLKRRLEIAVPKSKTLITELYTVTRRNLVRPAPLARSSSIGTQNELYAMENRGPRTVQNLLVESVIFESSRPDSDGTLTGIIDKPGFLAQFHALCELVKPILCSEQRVLELVSPTYVLGDIHGNMQDLRFFSEKLWTLGMHLTGSNFLFMGDYVDRGMMGIDVVLYLFAYKLKVPDKLFLLRGNHETRSVNGWIDWYKDRCFLDQCRKRFGMAEGEAVWENVNSVFDCLPLAARIDGSIFCVHGGIAPQESELPGDRITQMKNIPVPLQIPFPSEYLHTIDSEDDQEMDDELGTQPSAAGGPSTQGGSSESQMRLFQRLAFNLLWADPADIAQEKALATIPSGFCQGYRGEDSVVYGTNAVNIFLQETGCEMIMRAHEATVGGIKVCKQARVLTVFSTSKDHGVGKGASCACVLVDKSRVVVINRSPLYDEQFVQLSQASQ